jgi:hypothetical protein
MLVSSDMLAITTNPAQSSPRNYARRVLFDYAYKASIALVDLPWLRCFTLHAYAIFFSSASSRAYVAMGTSCRPLLSYYFRMQALLHAKLKIMRKMRRRGLSPASSTATRRIRFIPLGADFFIRVCKFTYPCLCVSKSDVEK